MIFLEIKNNKKITSMSQDRLASLSIIAIEHDVASNKEVINELANIKARNVKF